MLQRVDSDIPFASLLCIKLSQLRTTQSSILLDVVTKTTSFTIIFPVYTPREVDV